MATDHNPSNRRPYYHRGRRGMDRRGNDRRSTQTSEQATRPSGDQTDVDQIMREIRARISQRGIDLSAQQIQDLAARRLEAILEPRSINPALLEQLRKGAGVPPTDPLPQTAEAEYSFSGDSVYQASGLARFFQRLFGPLLKLLFNPAPVVDALEAQVRLNRAAAARAAELERRQTEWNALHYEILQRLVAEVARATIEMQALNARVEALATRVDFNDRRVRTLESAGPPARPPRPDAIPATSATQSVAPPESPAAAAAPSPLPSGDAPRRRRRRRRGRRGTAAGADPALAAVPANPAIGDDPTDVDEGEEEEALDEVAEVASPVTELPPPAQDLSPDEPAFPSPGPAPEMPAPVTAAPEPPAQAPIGETPAAPPELPDQDPSKQ